MPPKNKMGKSRLKLFIDASVFIAASASHTGGSAFILQACQKSIYKAVSAKLVLQEAKKNIAQKLDKKVLKRFYKLVKTLSLEIQPTIKSSMEYRGIIEAKDAHVLAGAIESQSDYLITLDRKHFFTSKIQQANFSVIIVTPKDFIQKIMK